MHLPLTRTLLLCFRPSWKPCTEDPNVQPFLLSAPCAASPTTPRHSADWNEAWQTHSARTFPTKARSQTAHNVLVWDLPALPGHVATGALFPCAPSHLAGPGWCRLLPGQNVTSGDGVTASRHDWQEGTGRRALALFEHQQLEVISRDTAEKRAR